MNKAVINLTTNEYFIYSSENDKNKKLKKITDYSNATKIMTFLLKLYDKNITYDNCGECYWNKNDEIKDNIEIESLDNKLDEVPKDFLE